MQIFSKKLSDIKKQENQLRDQLESVKMERIGIESFLNQLSSDGDLLKKIDQFEAQALDGEYSDKWTWNKKIEYICYKKDEPLKTAQIVDEIFFYEPTLTTDKDSLLRNLRPIISSQIKNNRLFKFNRKGEKGNYLVYNTWVDEHGDIKEEYREKFDSYGFI